MNLLSFVKRTAQALLLFLSAPVAALVPTYTNLGAPAPTYGVQEQFFINAGVFPQDSSLKNPPAPTGTITFTVNGLPVGGPFPVSDGKGLVSFSLPGDYPVVATYSGDSYYAPSTSTYSFSFHIMTNPPRFGFNPANTSLTFPSGATTGNTVSVSFIYLNGFHGNQESLCTIVENNNEPPAVSPATCSLSLSPGLDGFVVNIGTAPPRNVTASVEPTQLSCLGISSATLLICAPLAFRRKRTLLLLIPASLMLTFTVGCSGNSSGMPYPQPTRTISSAGHYTVHLNGRGMTSEFITLAQPADISVTVQ